MSKEGKKQSIRMEKHERLIFRHSKTYDPTQKLVQFLGETGARKRLDDVERFADRFVYTLSALELFENFAICPVFFFCKNVR